MFTSQNLPLLINRATLKVAQDAEGNRVRIAELALLLEPLPYRLAGELDADLVGHLFDANGQIKRELEDVTLNPRVGNQRVTVMSAPDAPVLATLRNARVIDLAVKKMRDKEGHEWLKAVLTISIDLSERTVREFLFHHFGELRLFTFLPEQLRLQNAAQEFVQNIQSGLGADESVTISTPRGNGARITRDKVEALKH